MNPSSQSNQTPHPQTAQRPYLLLGTAGHIDHGKTSLIKALTGVDTDRLPEEKQRGMTIELGFAHLDVGEGPDRVRLGIVDVPGHEKFVRTMVAGATAIDMVLLVVAADDSVMPQTREHMDIVNLLGVRRGVAAVTKCDLVDDEMAELVSEEVRELLADSPLADAPIVPVSSTTGRGVDRLKEALHRQARAVGARHAVPLQAKHPAGLPGKRVLSPFSHATRRQKASDVFRLAIDRVFTIHGRGTVVTGSAISGTVSVGDTLELLPAQKLCKVRGLQTHFDQADTLRLGQRVAVNLTGIVKDEINRGDELALPGYLSPSTCLDAQLTALSGNIKPLKRLQRVRLCLGTRECFARLGLLETQQLQPDEVCMTQLFTTESVVAEFDQHYIIRDETDSRTLGGGTIIRPVSRRLGKTDLKDVAGLHKLLGGNEVDRLEEVLRFENSHQLSGFSGPLATLKMACLSGIDQEKIVDCLEALKQQRRLIALGEPGQLVAVSMIEVSCAQAVEKLRQFHHKHPDDPGYRLDSFVGWLKRKWGESIGAHVFEELESGSRPTLRILGRYCCLAEFAPQMAPADERLLRAMVDEYHQAAFQPPAVAALKCTSSDSPPKAGRVNKLIQIATATGQLVQVAPDIILHAGRLAELKEQMAHAIRESGGLTVADVRNMIDSSRKYVVPLLEYLDKTGFTKRVGDQRVLAGGS